MTPPVDRAPIMKEMRGGNSVGSGGCRLRSSNENSFVEDSTDTCREKTGIGSGIVIEWYKTQALQCE